MYLVGHAHYINLQFQLFVQYFLTIEVETMDQITYFIFPSGFFVLVQITKIKF